MNRAITELHQEFRQLRLAETAEELPKLLRQAEQSILLVKGSRGMQLETIIKGVETA